MRAALASRKLLDHQTLNLELATAATVERYQRLGITRKPDGLDPARNGPTVVTAPLVS